MIILDISQLFLSLLLLLFLKALLLAQINPRRNDSITVTDIIIRIERRYVLSASAK